MREDIWARVRWWEYLIIAFTTSAALVALGIHNPWSMIAGCVIVVIAITYLDNVRADRKTKP